MREEILNITMTVDGEQITGTATDQVRGPRGYSAYEVAVLLGYVGNEESWLESLKVKGDQGRSAYRVAVDEGFVGTVSEWRDSLIGPRGPVYDDSDLREQIDLELASLTRIASEAAGVATTKAGEAVDAKNVVVLRADEVDGHAVILYGLFDEIEDYRQEVYRRALESIEQAGIATTKAGEAVISAGESEQSAQASAQSALDAHTLLDDVAGLSTYLDVIHARLGDVETELFIRNLFMRGEKGFWVDPSDTSTLFQNHDRSIPASANGDPIGLVLDKSGNNYDLKQLVSTSRPKILDGGIVFDRVDDALTLTVPAGGITGTLFLATTRGTTSYGVSMPAGVWEIGNAYNPVGGVVSAVLVERALTDDEKARLHVFGIGKGGTEFGAETNLTRMYSNWTHLVDFPLIDTSNVINFLNTWNSCTGLTDFPPIDTSNVGNFWGAWGGCSGLTSFPLIDTSKGNTFYITWSRCSGLTSFPPIDTSRGTNFREAWFGCSGLTTFPLLDVSNGNTFLSTWSGCSSLSSFPENFFDNCSATDFPGAFSNTNLSQASIDGILVSINSNSTSNGTFNQTGGSAPSAVGQASIDAMRARGWTVTTTGDY